MAVQVSYPGVYIDEFAPGAPIQGVGTSTAAFIGVASSGDLDLPTKVTSFDQFKAIFGEQPVPGFYLWYAVRGFFENAGQVCYIVRASNGDYDELSLNDIAGNPVIRIRALQPGDNAGAVPPNPINVTITATSVVPNTTTLFQPASALTAAPAGRELSITNGDGVNFRPGDYITIAAAGERVQILRVTSNPAPNPDVIRISSDLTGAYVAGAAVRLADAPVGTRTIRIQAAGGAAFPPNVLVPGTILTVNQGGAPNIDSQVVDAVQAEPLGAGVMTYRVTFRQGLDIALSLDAANPATVQSEEFNMQVQQGAGTANYNNLSVDAAHPNYFVTATSLSHLIRVEAVEPPPPDAPPNNLPAAGPFALAGGANENLGTLNDNDFIAALNELRQIDDVNIIAIPDRITDPVRQALISHCEEMQDRFGVLDSQPPAAGVLFAEQPLFGANSPEAERPSVDSTRGYAALYFPWLRVTPATTGPPIVVPPSGHVCGIFARSDNSRGVHKAPANEIVRGSLGVARAMSDIDQGQLNLLGVNVIRVFQAGGRPLLWGARTTATDRNWQYVNVRRLFLFLEESIAEGIRYAIFEPNNLALWQKLKRSINDFLTKVWRDGGLFGAKAEDAFYVRIDEVLNPFSEQALGRLNIEIGVRPTYPAEFIIVRIGIFQGGSEVTEV
jgi:Bacteriophage tail sheath protein